MTERITLNRDITAEEKAVIRAALDKAAVAPEHVSLASALAHFRAIKRCGCGCDSVDFAEYDPANPPKPIAHATGTTARGGTVGVIVWGTPHGVTGLEIYDLGAGDGDLKLPIAESIRPW